MSLCVQIIYLYKYMSQNKNIYHTRVPIIIIHYDNEFAKRELHPFGIFLHFLEDYLT
jgi:hypothetical protein